MLLGILYAAMYLGAFSYLMFQGQMRNIGAGKALLAMLLPIPLPFLVVLASNFKSPLHEAMSKEFHKHLPRNLFFQPFRLFGALAGRFLDVIEGNLDPRRPITQDKAIMFGYDGIYHRALENNPDLELGVDANRTQGESAAEQAPAQEQGRGNSVSEQVSQDVEQARGELDALRSEMGRINDSIFAGYNKVGESYELKGVRDPLGVLYVGVPEERRALLESVFQSKGIDAVLIPSSELESRSYELKGYKPAARKNYVVTGDMLRSQNVSFFFDAFSKSLQTSWEMHDNVSAGQATERMKGEVAGIHKSFRKMLIDSAEKKGITRKKAEDIFIFDDNYRFKDGVNITSQVGSDGASRVFSLFADGERVGSIVCDPGAAGGISLSVSGMEQFLLSDSRSARNFLEFLAEKMGGENEVVDAEKGLSYLEGLTGPELSEVWCEYVRRPENISVLAEQTTVEGFRAAEHTLKMEEAKAEKAARTEKIQTEVKTERKTTTTTRKI